MKNKENAKSKKCSVFWAVICLIIIGLLIFFFVFSGKDNKKENLKAEINEYISEASADGTLKAIEDRWLNGDMEAPQLDFKNLNGKNGKIVCATKSMLPFFYADHSSYSGMVAEMLYNFCQKYGYKIDFKDFSDTNSMVLAVFSGKVDFAGSSISVTEDRKKIVDFSIPYFNNTGVIVMNDDDAVKYNGFSSLEGKKIGVLTGTIYHNVINQKFKNVSVFEYNTPSDLCQALESKKVDALANDNGVLLYALKNFKGERVVDTLIDNDHYAFIFPKSDSGYGNIFEKIATSFKRTLIESERWKQVLQGVATTLIITVISILAGTAIGFIMCMAYQKKNKFVMKFINAFSWLVRGLPTVVLLLIMYYIIFGSVSLSGTIVSIISFTIIFAVTICGLLQSGISSIDKGQFEAYTALGYKENDGFMKIILPQVIRFCLPGFKSEVIALIKATSIVGYIAVQDLTKTGDIIRSSTYEAFAPLILTAIIYFILAWILTKIVDLIEYLLKKNTDLDKYLKGVNQNVRN